MAVDLARLFAPPRQRLPTAGSGGAQMHTVAAEYKALANRKRTYSSRIAHRWQAVLTLDIRGVQAIEIAERLNMTPTRVSAIRNTERYREAKAERLHALDDEFASMKPLALNALRRGLDNTADDNIALRASEQWFKTAGYGSYSKTETATVVGLTAESIAAAMLKQQINVSVTVNNGAASAHVEEQDAGATAVAEDRTPGSDPC